MECALEEKDYTVAKHKSECASEMNNDIKQNDQSLGELCEMASKESSATSIHSCNKSCCLSENKFVENKVKEVCYKEEEKIEVSDDLGRKIDDKLDKEKDEKGDRISDGKIMKIKSEFGTRKRHDGHEKQDSSLDKVEIKADENKSDIRVEGTSVMLHNYNDEVHKHRKIHPRYSAGTQPKTCSNDVIDKSAGIASDEEFPGEKEVKSVPVSMVCKDGSIDNGTVPSLTDDPFERHTGENVKDDGSVYVDDTVQRDQNIYREVEKEKDDDDMEKGWPTNQVTSTPKLDRSDSQVKRIFEGNFCGQAKHKDGSLLPIIFQVWLLFHSLIYVKAETFFKTFSVGLICFVERTLKITHHENTRLLDRAKFHVTKNV